MSAASRFSAVGSLLIRQIEPLTLAGQRTLPVAGALDGLLPDGLPRGVTMTTAGPAARSLAFTAVAAATQAGSWLMVLGLADPGWRAAAELGVALHRVIQLDAAHTAGRDADCVAAALDGFDLVLIGPRIRLVGATQRRLAARARERGAVLIGVHESPLGAPRRVASGAFAPVADLRATTVGEPWQGLDAGAGRLTGRCVEVTLEGKRLPGRRRTARLWLPGPDGAAAPSPIPEPAGVAEVSRIPGTDGHRRHLTARARPA